MQKIGLMGRVAVSFGASTILPLVLTYLMFRGITTMTVNMLILVAAGFFLIGWVYMGILRPVEKLKTAVKRVESGDLDFTLESETDDEFGELMQAFDQMRLRLKLTQTEKIRDEEKQRELVSNIAHDLKTPLTAIRGYAEGLLDGVADTEEKKKAYIQTIYHKAEDMDRLIDELRYYIRIETNRIPYNFQHIRASAYFNDCAEDIRIDMESQGIRFFYEEKVSETTEIIADPDQLRKVINNIISNAVKYMDKEEKTVCMVLEDAGDFIQVSIRDNGKGIAKTDLPYIFQRFFRADSARNSMEGGSGIGLSIVKKIIEDSGGRIWANSVEGEGSTICFVLRKYMGSTGEE